jgi:undecaprenyl-diphosphatase
MNVVESVLLGALQGITEFIPVSSSGHLVVMRYFMNLKEIPLLYDVLLHISTLVVVVIVFRQRIVRILRSLVRRAVRRSVTQAHHAAEDRIHVKLAGLIMIATFLTGGIGVVLSRMNLDQYPRLAAGMFLVTAGILVAGRFARTGQGHPGLGYDAVGVRHAVILGIIQGLAVIPGISRSGSTISAALLSGLDREQAGELSFLISIPAILGATVLTLLRDHNQLAATVSAGALAAGIIAAFVVGFAALLVLLRLVRQGRLYLFSVYLIPLSVFTMLRM